MSAVFLRFTCEYLIFYDFESMSRDLSLEGVAIKYNICAIEPNLNHVGNNTERGGESVLFNSFQYTFQIYTFNYSSDIDH